jgi:hypothetical protein
MFDVLFLIPSGKKQLSAYGAWGTWHRAKGMGHIEFGIRNAEVGMIQFRNSGIEGFMN